MSRALLLALMCAFFVAVQSSQTYMLGVPGRYQMDDRNGYCGETSIQTLMVAYGVWIPQEVARKAGSNDPYKDLLPGEDYNKALRKLGIKFDEFTGNGHKEFFAWAKKYLVKRIGVVEVAYIKGGAFSEYDHVMPMVGIKTSSKTGYSPDDVVYVHTNYDDDPIPRRVGDYWCARSNKKDSWTKAGCVPKNTQWGHAIKGPVYLGIGPRVELEVPTRAEPGIGKSVTFRGRVRIRGLTPGKTYKLFIIHSLGDIPKSKSSTLHGISPKKTFNATTTKKTLRVRFASGKPAYFICV